VHLISTGECLNAVQAKGYFRENFGRIIPASSIKEALRRNGLRSRIRRKKPLLGERHRRLRYQFALDHKDWTDDDWKKVIWSDESKFEVFGTRGREYCWRRPGEMLMPHHVKPIVKHGGGSVMIWGCMTSQGVGFMCRIDNILDGELYREILNGEFLDTLEWYGLDWGQIIFQHDNDPKHTAKLTRSWFPANGVSLLNWPPCSPDLNPMENVWAEIGRFVRNQQSLPKNRAELWAALQEAWNSIGPALCTKLIGTMRERIRDVLKAKGGYTRW
jgi:hypothetical protein